MGKEEILRPAIGFTCLPAHLFTCSSTTCSTGQKPAFLIEQVKVEQAIRRTHKAGLREFLPREFTPHVLGVFFASRQKKAESRRLGTVTCSTVHRLNNSSHRPRRRLFFVSRTGEWPSSRALAFRDGVQFRRRERYKIPLGLPGLFNFSA